MWDSERRATRLWKDGVVTEVVLAQGGTQMTESVASCLFEWLLGCQHASAGLHACIYAHMYLQPQRSSPCHEVEALSSSSATILHHSVNPLLLFLKFSSSSLQAVFPQHSGLIWRGRGQEAV